MDIILTHLLVWACVLIPVFIAALITSLALCKMSKESQKYDEIYKKEYDKKAERKETH